MRALRIIIPAVAVLTLLGWLIVPALDPESASRKADSEFRVLTNDGILRAVEDPAAHKGRAVELRGQIIGDPGYDRQGTHLQVSLPAGARDVDVVVRYPVNIELTQGDFVRIKGEVTGRFKGETVTGRQIETVEIEAISIESAATETVVAPARAVWKTAAKREQKNVTVIIDRVEFSDTETRVYATIRNSSDEHAVIQAFNSFIKQGGRFYEPLSGESGYKEIPVDLEAGGAGSGILVFPPLNKSRPLDFSLTVSGPDWETGYDFTLRL